ncbi:MAG: ubiquitin-activating E1 FCCH domain-containing protein [Patescibacteria group bacterium]
MPFGKARYGAMIQSFTLANPCVITVDTTQFFQVGDEIRIANTVSMTSGLQLNGTYTVDGLTTNTITINQDTSSYGAYISGGIVSILEGLNPNPNPFKQENIYHPLLPWTVFNQAKGGGTIPFV